MAPEEILAGVIITVNVWAIVEAYRTCGRTKEQVRWVLKSGPLVMSLVVWLAWLLEQRGIIGADGGALGLLGVLAWLLYLLSSGLLSRLDRGGGRW